ncbi:MAG: peptidoglycan DD-metalloendopeptidase family protein [Suilimivivens sp.]
MRRKVKRRGFSKEQIIMAASSVMVLGALTAAGIFMRQDNSTEDQGYVVDLSEIENSTVSEDGEVKVTENAAGDAVTADDLDYDPYFQETNSMNVENPDLSESESMSEGVEEARAQIEDAVVEDEAAAAVIENTDADEPAISTAMQPTLSFGDDDPLVWPVVGNILINYSMDKTIYFPTLDQYKYNPAIVIQANEGDMITAAAAGKVTSVFTDPQIGNGITMELGNGYEITYGQLEGILVSEGSYVSMGDMIAQVAAPTKYYSVEGTNVYFKLTKDGEPVNPMTRLN